MEGGVEPGGVGSGDFKKRSKGKIRLPKEAVGQVCSS